MIKFRNPIKKSDAIAEKTPLLQLYTEWSWMFYHLTLGVTAQLQRSLQRKGKGTKR